MTPNDRVINKETNWIDSAQETPTTNQKYESLNGNNYLDDTTINDTIRKIVRNKPTISYLTSYFMSHITNPNNNNTRTARSERHKLQTNTHILHWCVPHCDNSHWYYIKIDRQNNTILKSDPLNTRGQHFGAHLVETLQDAYPRVWTLEYQPMTQQHNRYDCGPYVLNRILHEVNRVETDGIPSRIRIKRFLLENINITSFDQTKRPDIEQRPEKITARLSGTENGTTTEKNQKQRHKNESHNTATFATQTQDLERTKTHQKINKKTGIGSD